jgi:hypothetical protein
LRRCGRRVAALPLVARRRTRPGRREPAAPPAARKGRREPPAPPAARGRHLQAPHPVPVSSDRRSRTPRSARLLRLAHAQDTVVIPAYLATIPHHLSLDSPAPLSESEAEVPLLELIEQRATQMGVRVDSRIERGRIHRHALTALLENEGYDTLAVPAKTSTTDGFDPTDIAWLLENAPGEVLVLHRLVGFTAYSPHNRPIGELGDRCCSRERVRSGCVPRRGRDSHRTGAGGASRLLARVRSARSGAAYARRTRCGLARRLRKPHNVVRPPARPRRAARRPGRPDAPALNHPLGRLGPVWRP